MFKLGDKLLKVKSKVNNTIKIFNDTIADLTTANDNLHNIALESMDKANYYDGITEEAKNEIENNNKLIDGIKELLK